MFNAASPAPPCLPSPPTRLYEIFYLPCGKCSASRDFLALVLFFRLRSLHMNMIALVDGGWSREKFRCNHDSLLEVVYTRQRDVWSEQATTGCCILRKKFRPQENPKYVLRTNPREAYAKYQVLRSIVRGLRATPKKILCRAASWHPFC